MTSILVVDDKEENLYTFEMLVEQLQIKNGFEIELHKALCGNDALEIAFKYRLDMILLDIQMPLMNGFEVAKYLKSSSKTKHIPIIFVTAVFKSDEFIKNGYDIGAIDYITKPIDKEIFFDKMRNHITIFEEQKKLLKKHDELKVKHIQDLELTKEKILMMFTHELKTPLNGMIGFSSHIAKGLQKLECNKSTKKYTHLALEINALGQSMLSSIISMLDLAKLKDGKLKLVYQDVDITQLIEKTTQVYKVLYDKEVLLELEDMMVQTDPQMIKHIFENLFTNALKYGDTKVLIRFEKQDANRFRLDIEDDGKGIEANAHEKIFEMFEQAEEIALQREKEGTGIGLHLVKKLCDFMHYEIEVGSSSTLGGARFSLYGAM